MADTNEAPVAAVRKLGGFQLMILVLLRVGVGWHFLYEGLSKLSAGDWTSAGYLKMSRWVAAPLFAWITSNADVLRVVDLLTVYGQIAIGLGLIVGLLTRLAAFSGIVMLAAYYVAYPPFGGLDFGAPSEGPQLIVNRNLIELLALASVLFFPTGQFMGLDRLFAWVRTARRARREQVAEPTLPVNPRDMPAPQPSAPRPAPRPLLARRELLGAVATVPFLGAFVLAIGKSWGWQSFEEKILRKRKAAKADAVTSATVKTFDFSTIKDLKGQLPKAKIGKLELSRMILGGNLIGGWAHARDLIYASKLVKAYHHPMKVFETFLLAEKCGVNTILTNPVLCGIIGEYWRRGLGKIQFISDCGGSNLLDMVRQSIDGGAVACYVQGGTADGLVREGKFDVIAKALELTRKSGLPAGIGGHQIETIQGCVKQGLSPDFWMKTLHHTDYWSAKPAQQCDNIFCEKPAETIAFMKDLPQPWIAFKILAAGAIHPQQGFRYAFQNGADFICVGMYDFQVVEDVNIALDALKGDLKRARPWRA